METEDLEEEVRKSKEMLNDESARTICKFLWKGRRCEAAIVRDGGHA